MKNFNLIIPITISLLYLYSCGGTIDTNSNEPEGLSNIKANILSSSPLGTPNSNIALKAILTGNYSGVTYTWSAENGTIIAEGSNVTYTAGATGSSASCNSFPITLNVSDSSGRVGSATYEMFIKIPGDIDANGVANYMDVILLTSAFLTDGEIGWLVNADLNGDGIVNGLDVGILKAGVGVIGCNFTDICTGDYDFDGDVDDDDLTAYSANLPPVDCSGGGCECDFDLDDDCDADDETEFYNNYGRTDCGMI